MKYGFLVIGLILLVAKPVTAQVLDGPPLEAREQAIATPSVLHVTDWLTQQPEGQEALASFRLKKAQGLLPSASKHAAALGDTVTFKVYNFRRQERDEIDFELKAESGRFFFWVELGELDNGRVTDTDVETLVEALADTSPEASLNPDAGVIPNDETVFCEPGESVEQCVPNVDGDGKTDVLFLNIRDRYIPFEDPFFINGFVDPADFDNEGNARDVIYLDTWPTFTDFGVNDVALAAAHEYQHLIHFNYDADELTLVNEGLSEWAEIVNGYDGRTINYLSFAAYNVNLLRWSGEVVPDVIFDYQRGGLFTTYLAEQLGTPAVGSITRETTNGAQGYRAVLEAQQANVALEDLVETFHLANLINDTGLDPRYGYITPQRQTLAPTPAFFQDGRLMTATPDSSNAIQPGGVDYLVWEHVEDLMLTLDVSTFAESVRPNAVLYQNGSVEVRPLGVGASPILFEGAYDRIAIVMAHVVPDGVIAEYTYSATWTADQLYEVQTVVYDDGIVPPRFPNDPNNLALFVFGRPQIAEEAKMASRFIVPPGTILASVTLGVMFAHDVNNSGVPLSEPRDLTLKIWREGAGSIPGDELFSLMEENFPFHLPVTDKGLVLTTKTIDLRAYEAQLNNLPSPLYIGFENAGLDENTLVMGVATLQGDMNPSLFSIPDFGGEWAPFPNVQSSGQHILEDRVLPIRATFMVPIGPVAVDGEVEVPNYVVLHANYPNPFNPTTTIRYSLPQATNVKLVVFDLLGREVATLVDGVIAPGEHQVQVNASDWASGVYFYSLEAAGQRQAQRMVLLK